MSDMPSPAPTAARRPASRARIIAIAAAFGAVIGALLVRRSGKPAAPNPLAPGVWTSPMAIALYLWIILSLYWEIAAKGASEVKSAESRGSRLLHLVMVNGAMLLSFWPFTGWPNVSARLFEFPRILPPAPFLAPLGVALAAAGFTLAIWARHQLGRNWSGAVTAKVDHELVRSGPYRRIRHPIYTGAIGMYVGTALISGRLQGILAIAVVAIAYARKIGLEERNLVALFGPVYDAYRRESWALIPWIL